MIVQIPATGRLIGPRKGDLADPVDIMNIHMLLPKVVIPTLRFDVGDLDEDAAIFEAVAIVDRLAGESDGDYATRRQSVFDVLATVLAQTPKALYIATNQGRMVKAY